MNIYYKNNRDKIREYDKSRWLNSKDKLQARHKKWSENNKNKRSEYMIQYRAINKDRIANSSKFWRRENPGKVCASAALRRATKSRATPEWANRFMVSEAYDLAQRRNALTGIMWHVDHIIPLRGVMVCGLHVETNLQVIPWITNIKKSNKFDTE